MDSLEAVQKSHQERIAELEGKITELRHSRAYDWLRNFNADQGQIIALRDRRIADLEKQVESLQARNDWQAGEVQAGWKFRDQLRNSTLELAEAQRRIAELEEQVAQEKDTRETGWNQAMKLAKKTDRVRNYLDSCRRSGDYTASITSITDILNGGN